MEAGLEGKVAKKVIDFLEQENAQGKTTKLNAVNSQKTASIFSVQRDVTS